MKKLLALALAVFLFSSVAYAAVHKSVQDLVNLPSSATAGDTCTVLLLGEEMTYDST